MLTATLALASPLAADTYQLEVPEYQVVAGGLVRVPLRISEVLGLASVRVLLNFDPALVTLEAIHPGEAARSFDPDFSWNEGQAELAFVRVTSAHPDSGGILAELHFRMNPGARTHSFSDLVIADFEVGDMSGVADLALRDGATLAGGMIRHTDDVAVSNGRNGLPDAWLESHGMNPLRANPHADTDGDGATDVEEFAFGGNPRNPDAASILPVASFEDPETGNGNLVLKFRKPTHPGMVRYELEESNDLLSWTATDITASMMSPPTRLDAMTERVTIVPSVPATGTPRGFSRIRLRW